MRKRTNILNSRDYLLDVVASREKEHSSDFLDGLIRRLVGLSVFESFLLKCFSFAYNAA